MLCVAKTGARADYDYDYDALDRQISAINHQPSTIRLVGSFTHYDSLGQVDWPRDASRNVTNNAYDALGQTNIVYSDGTPGVSYSYDPLGRQATIADGVGIRTFAYCDSLSRNAGFSLNLGHSVTYVYDPYGNTIAKTGALADANPFRFSTKCLDDETALYYYGRRFHSPQVGRWLNLDPIGESGGVNQYCFVLNRPSFAVDSEGRGFCSWVWNGIRWIWRCLIRPSPNPFPSPYPIPNPIPGPDPWEPSPVDPTEPDYWTRLADCTLTQTRDWCQGLAGFFECRYTCKRWYKDWPDGTPVHRGSELKITDYGCCPKPSGCPPMPDEEWQLISTTPM